MARRSSKMELIKKESTRKLTFQKRKTSLVKKISEISILCGVEACVIIYAPKQQINDDDNNDDVPLQLDTVWPSDSDKLKKILDRYKNTQKAKGTYTVSDYFAEKKRKVDSDISKLRNQINAVKYPSWDKRLDNFSLEKLKTLATGLDGKIEAAENRLNFFRQNKNNKDVMLQLSENYGMYMNRRHLEAYPPIRVPMPIPMPVWAGPNWVMNWQQQQQHQPQQQALADSNPMMIPNGGNYMASECSKFSPMSNGTIWQGQNYANNLALKLNNNSDDNSHQIMLPHQMVAPMIYQLPPPQGNFYGGPGVTDSTASWSGSSGFNF